MHFSRDFEKVKPQNFQQNLTFLKFVRVSFSRIAIRCVQRLSKRNPPTLCSLQVKNESVTFMTRSGEMNCRYRPDTRYWCKTNKIRHKIHIAINFNFHFCLLYLQRFNWRLMIQLRNVLCMCLCFRKCDRETNINLSCIFKLLQMAMSTVTNNNDESTQHSLVTVDLYTKRMLKLPK